MEKKMRWFFVLVTFLYAVSIYAYVPLLSSYASSLGANVVFVGMIVGIYGIMSIFLRWPLSIISDYWQNKKLFVTGGLFFTCLAALLPCFVQTPLSLFFGRLLGGIAISAWVHFNVLYASFYPPQKTAFAIGVINATMMIGNFFGALLCGALAPRWGVASVYMACAIIAGGACLLSLFFVQETKGKHKEPLSFPELYSVVKVPNVVYYSVLCAVVMALFIGTGQTITPLAAEHIFAANKLQLSILSGITIFGAAVSCLICDFIPSWMSEKQVLLWSFAITVLSNTLIPFAPTFPLLCFLQTTDSFFTNFLSIYLQVLVVKSVNARLETAATGLFQTIYCIGIAFGPIGAGLFQRVTGDYRWTFALLSLLPLIAMAAIVRHERQRHGYETSV